jgi:hypothetical protein
MKHSDGRSTLVDYETDFAKRDDADTEELRTRTILIVAAGGLEHGGGIGRQMGYFLRAYQQTEQRLRYRSSTRVARGTSPNHRCMLSVPLFILAAPSLRYLARVFRRPAWHMSTSQAAAAPFGRLFF